MSKRLAVLVSFILLATCLLAGTCPTLIKNVRCSPDDEPATCGNGCVTKHCVPGADEKVSFCSEPNNQDRRCIKRQREWLCVFNYYSEFLRYTKLRDDCSDCSVIDEDRECIEGKCYLVECGGCALNVPRPRPEGDLHFSKGFCSSDYQKDDDVGECDNGGDGIDEENPYGS